MYYIGIKGQVRPDGSVQNLVADFSCDNDNDSRTINVFFDVKCIKDNDELVLGFGKWKTVNFEDSADESLSTNIVDAAITAVRVVNRTVAVDILKVFSSAGISTSLLTDINWKENVDKAVKLGVKAAA